MRMVKYAGVISNVARKTNEQLSRTCKNECNHNVRYLQNRTHATRAVYQMGSKQHVKSK